ncbi:hypothetical protein COOONC_11339, partial [Cooperia oncophora]
LVILRQSNRILKLTLQVRGKNAPQYLEKGTLLSKKYRLEKMIGGGGFGQIYRAIDIEMGTVVAAKVEPQSEDAGRMVLEQMVLTKLVGTRHSPRLYASGWMNNYNFIVMQMLGRNLTELRKAQADRRFSVHTVQGMTRQFRLPNGEFRKERAYAAFRGTMRYVSLSVHERKEQGPRDDLWSIYYTLIELAEGSLPWRTITDHDEIFQLKRRMTKCYHLSPWGHAASEGAIHNPYRYPTADICRHLPRHFEMFPILLRDLCYTSIPDYSKLVLALRRCCKLVDDEADFEWDDENSSISN